LPRRGLREPRRNNSNNGIKEKAQEKMVPPSWSGYGAVSIARPFGLSTLLPENMPLLLPITMFGLLSR